MAIIFIYFLLSSIKTHSIRLIIFWIFFYKILDNKYAVSGQFGTIRNLKR